MILVLSTDTNNDASDRSDNGCQEEKGEPPFRLEVGLVPLALDVPVVQEAGVGDCDARCDERRETCQTRLSDVEAIAELVDECVGGQHVIGGHQ